MVEAAAVAELLAVVGGHRDHAALGQAARVEGAGAFLRSRRPWRGPRCGTSRAATRSPHRRIRAAWGPPALDHARADLGAVGPRGLRGQVETEGLGVLLPELVRAVGREEVDVQEERAVRVLVEPALDVLEIGRAPEGLVATSESELLSEPGVVEETRRGEPERSAAVLGEGRDVRVQRRRTADRAVVQCGLRPVRSEPIEGAVKGEVEAARVKRVARRAKSSRNGVASGPAP